MWLFGVCYEELTGVSIGPVVGHRDNAPLVVPQVTDNLVLELMAPNTIASLTSAGRVTGLDHKAFDVAVKYASFVVIRST